MALLTLLSFWVAVASSMCITLLFFFVYYATEQRVLAVSSRGVSERPNKKKVAPVTEQLRKAFGVDGKRGFRTANFFGWVLPAAYFRYARGARRTPMLSLADE